MIATGKTLQLSAEFARNTHNKAKVFIAVPTEFRDEHGEPNKVVFGYQTGTEAFKYVSIECINGYLTFSESQAEPEQKFRWNATISGPLRVKSIVSMMASIQFEKEKRGYRFPCQDDWTDKETGITTTFKSDALTTTLFMLKLIGFYFDRDSEFGRLEDAREVANIGSIPNVETWWLVAKRYNSMVTEERVKEALAHESRRGWWNRKFHVEFVDEQNPQSNTRKHLMVGGAGLLAAAGVGATAATLIKRRTKPKPIELNCDLWMPNIVFVAGSHHAYALDLMNGTRKIESVRYEPENVHHADGSSMSLCSQYITWLHNDEQLDKKTLHRMRRIIQLYQDGDTLYFYTKK